MTLVQKGNSKLIASDMLMFNLPATKQVCGRICQGCYAHGEQARYPNVLPARQVRFEASQRTDFDLILHKELSSKKVRPKYFRVHASGEFYSQSYVNSWVSIATQNSDIIFYAYTKRSQNFDFSKLRALSNFRLIDSLHYKGLNYGTLDSAPKEAFICPDQKGKHIRCGTDCTWCMDKGGAESNGVYFIKH